MGKRIFTSEQIADLLRNPNVTNCSDKSISYSNKFKVSAVKQYCEEGIPSREIFVNAGFDLNVIGRKTPSNRLDKWKKIFKTKGIAALTTEHRGKNATGRPKTRGMTDKEKIERLEATVAYLKAENDFLAKLRASKKR